MRGTLSLEWALDGGDTIRAAWERTDDGEWIKDFDVIYRRVRA